MLSRSSYLYEKVSGYLDQFVVFLGIVSIGILVFYYGFPLDAYWYDALSYALYSIAFIFVIQEVLRIIFSPGLFRYLFARRVEMIFVLLLSLTLFAENIVGYLFPGSVSSKDLQNIAIGYLALTQAAIFMAQVIRYVRNIEILSRYELTPSRLMVVSFLVPILLGALLLKLPNATVGGISWIDALFTATSAVCVTGLIVLDTSVAFTALGKAIICFLFQIGGLGIMTITMSFGFLFSRGLAVRERILFSELLAEERLGKIGRLLIQVTIFTLTAELIGALALYYSLRGKFVDFDMQIFLNSVFHAISAFCNAGFSLFSNGLYEGIIRDNVSYSFVIMGLIVVGGLGYPVFYNLFNVMGDKLTKTPVSRTLIKSHTKMVLVMTAILLTAGTAMIFLTEGGDSFADLSMWERLRQSLFLSVTSRTAGYNLWPTDMLSIETCFVLMFLMWVGGSPMSTAGGIKTLTLAVAWLNLTATLKGARKIIVFGREIASESVHKSYAIIFGSVLILALSSLLMIVIEPGKSRLDLVFEVVSAFGTVGLSRGVTGSLSTEGKILLVLLMFVGRLGFITVLNSFYRKYQPPAYKVLKENIPIS